MKPNDKFELKHAESYYIRVLLNKVTIKDIMVKKVISIHVDEPFSHVEEKLREFRIRHLPVIDDNNKLVGIVTQRDLYRISPPRKDEDGNWFYDKESLDNHVLKYTMTKNPAVLHPENKVAQAVLVMVDKKFGSIPVVDKDNVLCGIITQHDILKIAAQILKE